MNRDDIKDLHKARIMAGWSFVGLLIPLVGLILGGIALSTLKYLEPHTDNALKRVNSVKSLAYWGINLSVLVLIIGIIAGYIAYKSNQEQIREQNAAIQEAQDEEKKKESEANMLQLYRDSEYAQCTQDADKAYWDYVKLNASSSKLLADGTTTYYAHQNIWDYANESKKLKLDQCYSQYKT